MQRRKLSKHLHLHYMWSVIIPMMLVVAAVLGMTSLFSYQGQIKAADQQSRMLAVQIDGVFDTALREMTQLKNTIIATSRVRSEVESLLKNHATTDVYVICYKVTDEENRIFTSYPSDDEVVLLPDQVDMLELVKTTKTIAWSKVYHHATWDTLTVDLAMPLNQGRYLSGTIDLSVLGQVLSGFLQATDFQALIIGDDGQLVASSVRGSYEVESQGQGNLPLSIRLDGQVYEKTANHDLIRGWHLVFYDTFKTTQGHLFQLMLLILAILCVSMLVLNWWLKRHANLVVKHLNDLSNYFVLIGQGQYKIPLVHTPFEELEDMSDSVHKMVDAITSREREISEKQAEIESLNADLEMRIEDRTNKLIKANLYLERTLEDLKQTQSELVESEKMAALGNLVAGVAHEINTPIGVGLTAASYLQQETHEIEQAFDQGSLTKGHFQEFVNTSSESVTIIVNNLERASELVKAFKMIAVDQSSGDERVINLSDYIGETVHSLKPKLKNTRINVNVDVDDTVSMIVNPGDISQVTTNFIMNAINHAFDDLEGTIDIRGKITDIGVRLEFLDDGKGMPDHIKKYIFEPFFTTKRGQGGSGLGLNIVYNIITQKFRGTLKCESTEGKGTRFIIDLPLSDKVIVRSQDASHSRNSQGNPT